MFAIEYAEGVAQDIRVLSARDRANLLDGIETQLRYEPGIQTRSKKILIGLDPPWEYVEPIWQLRIGEYRVFYDIEEETAKVIIRAVRHNPPHKTTEEIL